MRKPIQLAINHTLPGRGLFALCDDGSIWQLGDNQQWEQLPSLPRWQWQEEFGISYAVPECIYKNEKLTDISWHNDGAPSFTMASESGEREPRHVLWVQHPDKRERDYPDATRFVVTTNDDERVEAFYTEDVNEALREFARRYERPAP